LLNKEHSESAREEEGKTEEPRQGESKTSGTASTVEVSTITPPIVLAALSNQSSQSYRALRALLPAVQYILSQET
jgi:hypothetical protein